MGSEWSPSAVDQRTFAQQQARVTDDLNRPDLIAQAPQYLQDAMRLFQRKAFFFNDTDNTNVPNWAASTIYTAGATIQATVAGTAYNFVAMNQGLSGLVAPVWPATAFTVPSNPPVFPPPASGTAGTVNDNGGPPTGIIWANNGNYQQQETTGFTTLYQINQYVMPIDLIKINLLEVTWQGNLRIAMSEVPYDQLRSWDVIRPFAPATYPAWYSWYNQQVYFWPYPAGLYPITISYRSAPPLAKLPSDSNVWTTQFEAGIRYYAEGLMQRLLLHDEQAAQTCFQQSQVEYDQLVSQTIAQTSGRGVQPSDW